ncbi:MAG: integrase [Bacteroidetes bacterium]|nr:integrase [Bacteroidota bacterium]
MNYASFLQYIQYEKRFSAHTVKAYQSDIAQFVHYLKEQYETEDLVQVNPAIVRSWLVSLMQENITARSIQRKITALKSMYRYFLKEGKIATNPVARIQAPKMPTRLPEFVEKERMDLLFSTDAFPNNYEGIRDQLILEIFYATGMRLSELVNLKTEDVDLSRNTLKVLGKRNKERIIPFGNRLASLIRNYIEEKKKSVSGEESKWLLVTAKSKQLYSKLVFRIVRHYLSAVTTQGKKSPHVLRHTFATHMLNNGADLNAIKELLGHANLAATQVYTHNSIEKLKNIYKQAHPRA